MSKKNCRIFWGNSSFQGPQLFLEQPKLVRQCLALLGFFSICIIFQIKNESLTHTVNFGIYISFDVQGWWSLSRFGPIQTDRKRGEGEGGGGGKKWTFFMDVIIVWSCSYFENGSSFFIKFQPKIPK